MIENFQNWLLDLGVADRWVESVVIAIGVLVIVLVAVVLHFIAKKIILVSVIAVIRRSKTQWDDVLIEEKVLERVAHFAPAIAINWLAPFFFAEREELLGALAMGVNIYLILIFLWVIDSCLNAVLNLYNRSQKSRTIPLKGFLQAVKLVVNLIGLIIILSIAFGKSPIYFFSGLGAVTAVLLLIFKDAILGFVAGIQISVNNMVQVGDWIEMPKNNADGDVIDVTLTTVKVQNWDKTITTVPTYALISDSFKNWRGMSEAGGRRIKRSINIDMNSIQFADEELLEKFKRFTLLKPYLEQKLKEVHEHNASRKEDMEELINGRHLTNIGTFRAYCLAYLRNSELVQQDMTLLVRQLQPTGEGLPIQIYLFTKDTRWAFYEGIQADIFDHLLAVIPQFKLRVYQKPSGKDLEALKG
ncbi:MAG: mechanosensitive ion channel family protein [Verrucomicrobiae bacterium]|nr:mechanosensitive ion channel family protein [Verrucomicrobiae bacterium]